MLNLFPCADLHSDKNAENFPTSKVHPQKKPKIRPKKLVKKFRIFIRSEKWDTLIYFITIDDR